MLRASWAGTKEARAGSHRDGAADPSDPVGVYPQALLLPRGFFYRVSALSGPRVAMQVEAAAIRPAVPGTHWKHSRRCKSGYPLGHDIIGNISDVVVPRSELS